MRIVQAVEGDLPGILEIYNQVILTSTAVYTDEPVDLEERARWLAGRIGVGNPVLVARDDREAVMGFASFGDWRGAWPGYRFTVEHSVHVRSDLRGTGVGTKLMLELMDRAEAIGKHVMIGGIDAENAASIRFHENLGFKKVAEFHEVGWKFGRWLDLVFMQIVIDKVRS